MPIKPPPTLYKYCDLRGLDVLRNLRLKVTPFNEFNDPFELAPRIKLELPLDVAKILILGDQEILQLSYRQMLTSGQFVGSYDEFVSFISQYGDRLTHDLAEWYPGQAAEFRRDHVNIISREFGLICFSALRDVVLMWSHYTRGHTGLVVGFRTDAPLFTKGPPVQDVEYLEERVLMPYPPKRGDPQLRKDINALIRRKSPHWKYEAEWRQLYFLTNCIPAPDPNIPAKSNYYFPIDESAISEVILGCGCTDKQAHSILRQKKFKHIRLLRAVQDDELFRLRVVDETPTV